MDIKNLHCGFDGLDLAFAGVVPGGVCDKFEEAKLKAQKEMGDAQLVKINGFQGHVKEHGARGGFAFCVDTGPEGEIWFFKRSDKEDGYNVRVSCKSAPLATLGYWVVKSNIFKTLDLLGIKITDHRVSRFDVAADFLMPDDWTIEPQNFVSRASRKENQDSEEIKSSKVGTVWMKDACTGVTIGQQPGRQFCIYDKRREVVKKQKVEWWAIWGLNKEDKPNIWRIEFRAGKKHLRDVWKIKTLEDLENSMLDVVRVAFGSIRYCIPNEKDKNRARWVNHPLWDCSCDKMADAFKENESGLVAGQLAEIEHEKAVEMYKKQFGGLYNSFCGLVLNKEQIEDDHALFKMASFLRDFLVERARGERRQFNKRALKARAKYHLINEVDSFVTETSNEGTVGPDAQYYSAFTEDRERGGSSGVPF